MPTETPSTSLTVHLVDSAKGNVVQTWRFQGCDRVVIGRAPECDIRLADKLVSRIHVEFTHDASLDKWTLKSHGRNGTLIQGTVVTEVVAKDRMNFQLGPSGPRFQLVLIQESATDWATVIGDTDMGILEFLNVDEKKKSEEVEKITEGDSFRTILARAKEIKQAKLEFTTNKDPAVE